MNILDYISSQFGFDRDYVLDFLQSFVRKDTKKPILVITGKPNTGKTFFCTHFINRIFITKLIDYRRFKKRNLKTFEELQFIVIDGLSDIEQLQKIRNLNRKIKQHIIITTNLEIYEKSLFSDCLFAQTQKLTRPEQSKSDIDTFLEYLLQFRQYQILETIGTTAQDY